MIELVNFKRDVGLLSYSGTVLKDRREVGMAYVSGEDNLEYNAILLRYQFVTPDGAIYSQKGLLDFEIAKSADRESILRRFLLQWLYNFNDGPMMRPEPEEKMPLLRLDPGKIKVARIERKQKTVKKKQQPDPRVIAPEARRMFRT